MNGPKYRIAVMVMALGLVVLSLIFMDWSDLSWSSNRSGYLGLISMSFIALSMHFSNKKATGKEREEEETKS